MRKLVTMREALTDPNLLGNILAGQSWEAAWHPVLIAAMGETLTPSERKIFRKLTGGRRYEPGELVDELWCVVGRRGGKSRAASVLATYLGGLCDFSDVTAVGEIPRIITISANTQQSGVVFGYIAGAFESSPMLASLITNRTADTLVLSTGVNIEVRAASARGLRGITAAAVIGDEAAFWNSSEDAAALTGDREILEAVRPTLATTGGPLIVISSPYAMRGEVYQTYKDHYGKRGDKRILVVQGASRDFNPSLPEAVVRRAMQRDAASARAEYLGEFRNDIESFISRPLVDACVVSGRAELPPVDGTTYFGFVDPSSGVSAGGDSMALGIAHRDSKTGRAVLDLMREVKPPFSPDGVVQQFCTVLELYGITRVQSDRWSLGWTHERFEAYGIKLEYSPRTKSEIFLELLPLLSGRAVELLDNPRLVSQLLSLDRRVARGGRESVDGGSAHDDLINAAAGALVLTEAKARRRYFWGGLPSIFGFKTDAEKFDEFARRVSTDKEAKRPDGTPYSQPLSGAARRSAIEQLRDGATQTAVGKEICGLMFDEDAPFRGDRPRRGPLIEQHHGLS